MDISTRHRFHLAPGYDPAAPDTWVWEDRSADVDHVDGGITIRGGRGDEVGQVDAGYATLRLDNAGGHYCTRNQYGRWYGRLARNTPARWGLITGAEAFTANTSNGWGIPDIGTSWTLSGTASDWSSSGGVGLRVLATANIRGLAILDGANARDGEATCVFSVPVVATGGPFRMNFVCRYVDASNMLLFMLEFGVTGGLSARIARMTAGSVFAAVTVGPPLSFTYSANQRIKMRCQWDGPAMRLKVWPEASGEPATWTATVTDDGGLNTITGSGTGVYLWRDSTNTNAGSQTVTVDNVEIESVEIVGTVPEWPVRWDPTAQVSWAPIQIAGITRRLNQGEQALRSPIYRQLIAQPAAAYWTLEDGPDATTASSALARGVAAYAGGVTFGSTDHPGGAASAATLNSAATSQIAANVIAWPVPQDGYAGMLYFRFPTLPGSTKNLLELRCIGTVARWVISVTATTIQLDGFAADGTSLVSPAGNTYTVDPTQWTAIQLETQESGGTVTWSLLWHQVGQATFYAQTSTYSGTADRITRAIVTAPVDGTLVSHLWLGDDLLAFVDTTFQLVSAGYAGELAADRIARLCREEGVLCSVEAGVSEPMGPQRIATLMDLLRAAEAGDQGVLYERGAGLGYRPHGGRYNRAVTMALAIAAAGDISDPAPEPTDDDQRVRNEWTLTRDGGGSGTDSDAVHIAANGRYPDSATINVQTDVRLAEHASWRVHLGTWGEMRWPSVTINLTDRPDLMALWLGRPFSPRITISGIPAQGPIGASADLVVEGWTQDITSVSWVLTLNCSPARPWDVGVYSTSLYDSRTSTLNASLTSGATSVVVTFTDIGDQWSQTNEPYLWAVAPRAGDVGETIRVDSIGAVSGTGPWTQTATVTRSINGIVMAHNAGESVRLTTSTVYAL